MEMYRVFWIWDFGFVVVRSFVRSFVRLFVRSFVRSFIRSFVRLIDRSFAGLSSFAALLQFCEVAAAVVGRR